MHDFSAAEEEIDREINSWGYTMNATDYMSGLQNVRPSASFARSAVPGRGRGYVDVSRDKLQQIRLAAQINRLEAHKNPIGHLPTTEETLDKDVGPEITAGLRSVGILSSARELNDNKTCRNVNHEDLRIDRNVPLMLSSDFFHARSDTPHADEQELAPLPTLDYDPSKPLNEQFTTIKEFQPQPPADSADEPEEASSKPSKKKSSNKKGKKQKWVKVPVGEFLAPPSWSDSNHGRPPLPVNSAYEMRSVYGSEGKHIVN
ncbi:uncharacterized protein LOC126565257 [Anopheles maculipalpis]|uniref:uncharacterized protein LOC126565257 n=1 Tax=Anopheles maculipalpis TaxID=1496333 RepID=UPI00215905FB|nr:uncharacterized protein LOC126565257 [Anopheles maculipalpis]